MDSIAVRTQKGEKKKNARFKIGRMFLAPQVGLEPTTPRLTAECSTIELSRNNVISISKKGNAEGGI